MKTIEKSSNAHTKVAEKMPCMYTPEEIKAGAKRFIKAYKSGDKSRFISHEELINRHIL